MGRTFGNLLIFSGIFFPFCFYFCVKISVNELLSFSVKTTNLLSKMNRELILRSGSSWGSYLVWASSNYSRETNALRARQRLISSQCEHLHHVPLELPRVITKPPLRASASWKRITTPSTIYFKILTQQRGMRIPLWSHPQWRENQNLKKVCIKQNK